MGRVVVYKERQQRQAGPSEGLLCFLNYLITDRGDK